ncbi:hypothetical protein K8T06_07390 [bacterium]|nr:hypothetical protein [bacterium]
MRILQIIHQFPKSNGAGSENYTRQICQSLSQDHSVALISMGDNLFDGPYGKLQEQYGYPFPVFKYFNHPKNSDSPEKKY